MKNKKKITKPSQASSSCKADYSLRILVTEAQFPPRFLSHLEAISGEGKAHVAGGPSETGEDKCTKAPARKPSIAGGAQKPGFCQILSAFPLYSASLGKQGKAFVPLSFPAAVCGQSVCTGALSSGSAPRRCWPCDFWEQSNGKQAFGLCGAMENSPSRGDHVT